MNLPRYAELHVVSDLHMGGEGSDFQILAQGARLGDFVRWVARQRPDEAVALVLNGDVFDTLAEDVGGYVAVDDALTVIERIMEDPSFSPVFGALSDFVRTPNRTLVMVVGNHDIELAFPLVQRMVVSRLAMKSLEARARIEFATVGAGYSCMVGAARVFCTHGNEVDPWNYVRYEDLSKAARRMNCGVPLDPSEWEPNAGTKLVKDVMNAVKRRYAWIDLLKPETQAAIGVLLVLDPKQLGNIRRLPAVVGELARGALDYDGRLGADGLVAPDPKAAGQRNVDQLLGANVAFGVNAGAGAAEGSADDMLRAAEANFETPRHGPELTDDTLGVPRLLWDRLTGWITRVGRDEALRRALVDWLADDKTFDFNVRDDTFKRVTASIGEGIDFIVTGHTHLERAVEIGGGRYYFNSGTWIRLLRFTNDVLHDAASFKPVYEVLEKGTMGSIDEATFGGEPFVLDQSTAVSIKTDPRGVTGALCHVVGGAPMVKVVHEFLRPS